MFDKDFEEDVKKLADLLKADADDDDDDDDEGDGGGDDEGGKDEDEKYMKGKKKYKKGEGSLFGHDEPDGDEGKGGKGDDDGDEASMKKMMKKYCKSNKAAFEKHMKSMGFIKKAFDEEIAKASDDLDEADSVLINGTDIVNTFVETIDAQAGIIKALGDDVVELKNTMMKAAPVINQVARVLAKMAEGQVAKASTPHPRRGMTIPDAEILKAATDKGMVVTIDEAKRVIKKAYDMTNDHDAIALMTKVENCHGNLALIGMDGMAKLNKFAAIVKGDK